MRPVVLAVALVAACDPSPCSEGRHAVGWPPSCCLDGQGGAFGQCWGIPEACPAGHELEAGTCQRVELPAFRLVRVPAGTYDIGCREGRDPFLACDGGPARTASLDAPLLVMATEVPQDLYEALAGDNPSRLRCATCPVHSVDWPTALRFANALSAWEGLPGAYRFGPEGIEERPDAGGYRLLTEDEWEIAGRAGEDTMFAGGDDADAVAWWEGNNVGSPQPVATKAPNAWGLYDMSGNVWEWTASPGRSQAKALEPDRDAPDGTPDRVLRGGAWSGIPSGIHLSYRGWVPPNHTDVVLGFRVGRALRAGEGAVVEPAGPWTAP